MTEAPQAIQAEPIKSSLTTTEYAIRGSRAYFLVLFAGSANYINGDYQQSLVAPGLIWSPVRQTARVSLPAGTRGFVLRVPETLLGRAIPSGPIARYVTHAISSSVFAPDLGAAQIDKLDALFREIETELYENEVGADSIVQHCVSLLLIQVWRASNPLPTSSIFVPQQIVYDFFNLVDLHVQSHWPVVKYAEQLGISKDRLNSAVRRTIGTSPHRYIQSRLIEETKNLLLTSDLQVAEIAYRLGFSDAAYFNRFFQRHMNISPGRYRSTHLNKETPAEVQRPFAAWP